MVRGPEEQFAYQIERIQHEEGFWQQGSVITKMQDDGTGSEYGPYAWLVSPPSHGRNWYYLGRYEEEIDIDWRLKMDYHRKYFRDWEIMGFPSEPPSYRSKVRKIANNWYFTEELESNPLRYERKAYGFKIDPLRKAKERDEGYKQALFDTIFARWFYSPSTLGFHLLDHIQEEIVEIHLDEDIDEIVDLDLVREKYEEWGKIPSDYERFKKAVEEDEKPKFRN